MLRGNGRLRLRNKNFITFNGRRNLELFQLCIIFSISASCACLKHSFLSSFKHIHQALTVLSATQMRDALAQGSMGQRQSLIH